MELRHLRYFIAVAEEMNFSRAAKKLNMAQPPLSQQIQALEKELDAQLFDRRKRPIELTLAGQFFLQEADKILLQLEQSVRAVQQIEKGEKGVLTVGFTSSIANSILPDISRSFQVRFPEVELVWRELSTQPQLQGIRKRQIDIGFFHLPNRISDYADLEVFVVLQEPLVVAVPDNHPLATESQIKLESLTNERLVLPSRHYAPGLSEQIYSLFHKSGIAPNVVQEATLMLTILGLVAGRVGVSILPANAQNLQRKGVLYRALANAEASVDLAAFWRCGDHSLCLANFIEVVKAVVRSS